MSLCRVWSHRWLVYFHSESAWVFLGFFVVRVCECGEHFSLDQQYISTAGRCYFDPDMLVFLRNLTVQKEI